MKIRTKKLEPSRDLVAFAQRLGCSAMPLYIFFFDLDMIYKPGTGLSLEWPSKCTCKGLMYTPVFKSVGGNFEEREACISSRDS